MKRFWKTAPCLLLIVLTAVIFGPLAKSLAAQPPSPSVAGIAGEPPTDAAIIFNGQNSEALLSHDGQACPWPIQDGALIVRPGSGNVWSKLKFRDAQVHLEFATPKQGPGNSGLYFHGLFELQIYNSFGSPTLDEHTLGALYSIAAPLANAARAGGQWQSYDVVYMGPHRDANGKVERAGSITALLNGVLVQNHVEFRKHVSPYAPMATDKSSFVAGLRADLQKSDVAPLCLQDHGAEVRFRNIWIRRLDNDHK